MTDAHRIRNLIAVRETEIAANIIVADETLEWVKDRYRHVEELRKEVDKLVKELERAK